MKYALTFTDPFLCADRGIILHCVQCEVDLGDGFLVRYGTLHGFLHGEGHFWRSQRLLINGNGLCAESGRRCTS